MNHENHPDGGDRAGRATGWPVAGQARAVRAPPTMSARQASSKGLARPAERTSSRKGAEPLPAAAVTGAHRT